MDILHMQSYDTPQPTKSLMLHPDAHDRNIACDAEQR